MRLTEDEKARIKVVIGVTSDDESRLCGGIIKALRDVSERGTRIYLWHVLEREARKKIRTARRVAEEKAARRRQFAPA